MQLSKIIFPLLGMFYFLSILSCKQIRQTEITKPESFDISSDSLAKMNAYFHQLVDEKKLAGIQTAVIRHGELIQFDSYGYSDIENEERLDSNSIFRIFSMTKPIVSVALMQLFEQGKFELNDPIYQYMPEFENMMIMQDSTLVPAETPIAIIDLLRHTSGFGYGRSSNPHLNAYYGNGLFGVKDNQAFSERASGIPLQFEPGTNWQYGISTGLVGRLIEVISGQSLDDYLQEHVLNPLKMVDTHFQLPMSKVDRLTVGYRWNEENGLSISDTPETSRYINEVTLFNGGGGLVSSMSDYLRFCQMILNKGELDGVRILKSSTIDRMLTDHLDAARSFQDGKLSLPAGEAGFGFGFAIRGKDSESMKRVYGWGGAVGTYFKIDLEHDLAYVMMIQLFPHRHLELRRKIQDFMDAAIID